MITFSFNGSDKLVLNWLSTVPSGVVEALRREMIVQMLETKSIVVEKLSGEVLSPETGRLRASLVSSVESSGSQIVGQVGVEGSASGYGKIQEYGGTINVREHLRKTSRGVRIIKAHSVVYGERSYLRSTLVERSEGIVNSLQEAINYYLAEKSA